MLAVREVSRGDVSRRLRRRSAPKRLKVCYPLHDGVGRVAEILQVVCKTPTKGSTSTITTAL
jgi:hypothetical protein